VSPKSIAHSNSAKEEAFAVITAPKAKNQPKMFEPKLTVEAGLFYPRDVSNMMKEQPREDAENLNVQN
jgi:hypothetical protein